MKIVLGDYNEDEKEIKDNQVINDALNELKYVFKPELVKLTKTRMEVMSEDSGTNSFVIIEGLQEEIEELSIRLGWRRFINWSNYKTVIPSVGLQIKHKQDKKLYTVTNIDYYAPTISICSRRGIISQLSEVELFEQFKIA